jgi:hypothetical protein
MTNYLENKPFPVTLNEVKGPPKADSSLTLRMTGYIVYIFIVRGWRWRDDKLPGK